MKNKSISLVMAIFIALCSVVFADTFTETFHDIDPLFRSNQAAFLSHVITPAKTALDPAETTVPDVMYLLDWTYAKSSSGFGATGEAYLGVLTWDGNLNNSTIVGISTNTVNMAATANTYPDSLMTWEFDYVPLAKDTQYAIVWLVPGKEEGTWNLVTGGVELEVSTAYPWGGVIQSGFTTINQPNWNPHFIATYSTATPYVSTPDPANGADNVPVDVELSWIGPNAYAVAGYDVYIDPNETLVAEGDLSALEASTDQTSLPVSLLNGTTYYWRVDVYEPNDPAPILHAGPVWSFTTVPAEAIIVQHPAAQTVDIGAAAELSVHALNAETYQWYKDGEALSGQTASTLVIENVQVADEGFYHCVADNTLNVPAVSNTAQLLTRRLVGWWKLDGDLDDAINEVHPGAPAYPGAAFDPDFVEGINGSALEMYGDPADVVNLADTAEFYNFYPRGYTVSAWVQTEVVSPWGAYVSKQGGQPGAATGFILTKNASGRATHTLRQSFGDLSSNYLIADGAWHLVTGTYDAATGQGKIYVNGVLRNQATSAGVPQPNAADLMFGAEWPDGSVPHIGLLDDVRIWSYPLDAYAVARLYVEVKPDEEICLGYPEFDIAGPDGIGQQFRDCRVDLYDFAAFAQSWLECNIVPECL